jgi:nucleoside-diphosphate-sugar epimerase
MRGTVLVTGASGFIGRDLVRRLAADGWRVRAAARGVPDGIMAPGIEGCTLPDLKRIVWRPLLSGVTHVVHLAGIAHGTRAMSESTYMEINAVSVRSLAEAARSAGLKRVVFLSSIRAQTGPEHDGPVSERELARPIDAYGRSKLAAEEALASVLEGGATDWVSLRPVLVYGPGVKGNLRTLFNLARTRWPLPVGGFKGRRSIVSLDNLGSAIGFCLESEQTSRGRFLVADEDALKVGEMVAALRAGLGRNAGVLNVPQAPLRALMTLTGRASTASRLCGSLIADTSALRAAGWRPQGSAASGLADAIKADKV